MNDKQINRQRLAALGILKEKEWNHMRISYKQQNWFLKIILFVVYVSSMNNTIWVICCLRLCADKFIILRICMRTRQEYNRFSIELLIETWSCHDIVIPHRKRQPVRKGQKHHTIMITTSSQQQRKDNNNCKGDSSMNRGTIVKQHAK